MPRQRSIPAVLAALAVLLSLPFGPGSAKGAKQPSPAAKASPRPKSPSATAKRNPPAVGAIALIADRRVEEADIQRAALVMERDPLRRTNHALWRRKLLDLCVDRELLALEAERAGFLNNPDVSQGIERGSADLLYAEIRDRYLIPEIIPTASQIDTARAGGLYRRVKVDYILAVTDHQTTFKVYEELRNGASFDSIAALYSVHPSAAKAGSIGWKRIGALNQQAWKPLQHAKPGDLFGPYENSDAHEIYKVEAIEDPDDAELRETMLRDRRAELDSRYRVGLLRRYRFQLDPEGVSSVIFAAATEPMDSILASLDEQGRRPKIGVHPALGVIARLEGDSITYRELAQSGVLQREPDGKAHIEDSRALLMLTAQAVLPRLIARDARERGVDKDPSVARKLRLIREEVSTRAMVARAVPLLTPASIRAYFDSHGSRYRRPAARRAMIAMFASEDTARAAALGWSRASYRDSVYGIQGFRKLEGARTSSLWPRFYGEIPVFDSDSDPLSAAVRSLEPDQISSVIPSANGYAVAMVKAREPARAYAFEEVSGSVAVDARDYAEDAWVTAQLQRLRAATPARTVPARLEAVRLGMNSDKGGTRR
jgi:hypothetical protein